ncbi:hypothetical protein J2T09_003837 [Neorhizobium huautlense]|uniref:Uncharacterized protein n=1 Tax=Neorhizobium huautlense TaxID=67774 RepID=A0ABT9PXC2_9HYPH|nr:hypothetical protein [Neorhizobium huautlense]MDP9839062.1 hypothetical protein [Neorhizobium huautlense]
MSKAQQRDDAAISRMTASNMSNAKWKKLFDTLVPLELGKLRWKFVRNECIYNAGLHPFADSYLETGLGDVLPSPYGPYRNIEWIEIAEEHAEKVLAALQPIGRFPFSRSAHDLKVVAYNNPDA